MLDCFNRNIDYLRVSVTDRCNLRCIYCMPEEGVQMLTHNDILTYDEIADFVHYAVGQGITKVRITGGEPLVRKGIVSLVSMIAAIPGIVDLSMTSNGLLLDAFASQLKEAGLMRINVSLDTLDAAKYRQLTRGGDLQAVIKGIHAARDAGFAKIKINTVIPPDGNRTDALLVKQWAEELGLECRFIHQMDLGKGHFSMVEGGSGGHCASCNRLRLTADGYLAPCLFSDQKFSIRTLGAAEAFQMAVQRKPEKGNTNSTGQFYNIGG